MSHGIFLSLATNHIPTAIQAYYETVTGTLRQIDLLLAGKILQPETNHDPGIMTNLSCFGCCCLAERVNSDPWSVALGLVLLNLTRRSDPGPGFFLACRTLRTLRTPQNKTTTTTPTLVFLL